MTIAPARIAPARIAKTGMVASLGLFALLVTLNNMIDYGSNFSFVQHVLSMDTILPGSTLRARAITLPWAWHGAYAAIIATEFATGGLFVAAAVSMTRQIRAGAASFAHACRLVPLGTLCGFLLWFTGFETVGGEWFAMWQSQHWNGQEPAFRFFLSMLAVAIYVAQPE